MTCTMQPEQVVLRYRQGGSDKVYQVHLESSATDPDRWKVHFAFGRYGSPLQTGSKIPDDQPVPYAQARKLFDRLVAQKIAKGYGPHSGESGTTPYQDTPLANRATGIEPQLLNPIRLEEVERYLADPSWLAQEKFDGHRRLIRSTSGTSGEILGVNRRGLSVALPSPIRDAAHDLPSRQWLLDGEQMGETFVAFDLLEQDGQDLRSFPYHRRLHRLYGLVPLHGPHAIRAVESAMDSWSKRQLFNRLCQRQAEGIVFKQVNAGYAPGRPASGGPALKLKFVASASCLVAGISPSRRSVMLEVWDESHQARIPLGNVAIPPGSGYSRPRQHRRSALSLRLPTRRIVPAGLSRTARRSPVRSLRHRPTEVQDGCPSDRVMNEVALSAIWRFQPWPLQRR